MLLIEGIYLLLGTNLGDRPTNLWEAQRRIEQLAGKVTDASTYYESEAWGVTNQPNFYNQVLRIETTLSHEPLLRTLQAIEQQMGKVKLGHWRERVIDIDLLYYGNRRASTTFLSLPHPQIPNRRFTLLPLCEIAAEQVHPVLYQTHRQLLAQCPDPLQVWKVPVRKRG